MNVRTASINGNKNLGVVTSNSLFFLFKTKQYKVLRLEHYFSSALIFVPCYTIKYILYSGNAKDYVNLNKNKFTPNGNIPVKCCDQYNHRAKIVNNEVYCRLHISANGNIGFDEERSYELADKLTFGNILDNDITSLILKHNDNCLLRCEETTDLTTFCDTWRFVPNVNSDSRIYFQIVGLILEKFILARTIAKEKFKYVTAQDLIENIPFPQVGNKMPNLVERIYNRYSKQFLNPYSYTNALLYVLNLLESDDIYVFPDYDFGTLDDLLNSYSFRQLEELNEKYKSGVLSPLNNKVFPCEDNE